MQLKNAQYIGKVYCAKLGSITPKLKHIKYITLHFSIHLRIISNICVSIKHFTALLNKKAVTRLTDNRMVCCSIINLKV